MPQDFSTSTFDLEGQMLIFKPSADTKHQNKYEMCKQPLLNSLHPDVPSSAAEKLKMIEDRGGSKMLFLFDAQPTVSWWFGFLRFPYEKDCYFRVPLESQTPTPPNLPLVVERLELNITKTPPGDSQCSKKSPTGPTEWTPKPVYLIALATYLGVCW